MEPLHILSLALVTACLAGVNLYLVTFLAGLAGRIGWLPLEGEHAVIGVLAHPAVMTVAALLYLLEAIVDKIPAVDSIWDALHTVIRPAGAVLLALHIMGNADPAYQALAGILAGLAGLTTHLAKAATRLSINNSPGPLANLITSLTEDILVSGLFILTVHKPVTGFIICVALVVLLWALFPRMFRTARASLFLMWKKVRLPAGALSEKVKLGSRLSAEQDMLMHGQFSGPCTVAWAARCVTGRCREFPALKANTFGHLVSVKEHPGALLFLGRRWFQHMTVKLPLTGCEAHHEGDYLSENLDIYSKADRRHAVLRFTRAEVALAARLEEELHGQSKRAAKSATEETKAPAASPDQTPAIKPIAAPIALTIEPAQPLFTESPLARETPTAPATAPSVESITPFPPDMESASEPPSTEPTAAIAEVAPMPVVKEATSN